MSLENHWITIDEDIATKNTTTAVHKHRNACLSKQVHLVHVEIFIYLNTISVIIRVASSIILNQLLSPNGPSRRLICVQNEQIEYSMGKREVQCLSKLNAMVAFIETVQGVEESPVSPAFGKDR